VGHYRGDLEDAVAAGIQPGHLQVDPDQAVLRAVLLRVGIHALAGSTGYGHDSGSPRIPHMLQNASNGLGHYAILTAMLAPAFFLTATAALLASANARLARVVDRLRSLIVAWDRDARGRAERDEQIRRHRERAHLVLRACRLLYAALAGFVGTSLTLAMDAFFGFRIGTLPTALAVVGVLFLLAASVSLWREVSLAVKNFDGELDQELARKRA